MSQALSLIFLLGVRLRVNKTLLVLGDYRRKSKQGMIAVNRTAFAPKKGTKGNVVSQLIWQSFSLFLISPFSLLKNQDPCQQHRGNDEPSKQTKVVAPRLESGLML